MALIDISGQTFGKLQVVCISEHSASSGERLWVCECECGNICRARGGDLRSGLKTCCPECGQKRGAEVRKMTMAANPKPPKPPKPPEPPKPPKPPKPVYEAKEDCRAYVDGRCAGLKEMFCKTRGKCKFYKSREGENK